MEKGPPIWLSDPHGLPLPEGDSHADMLWFSSDGQVTRGRGRRRRRRRHHRPIR
jgi:hypothetical protein